MEIVQFIFSGHFAFAGANLPVWILFVALAAVLILLAAGPVNRLLHGVKMVSPAELVLLINRRDGVVVDVRGADEFRAGHVTGALNVSLPEFKDRLRELEKY